MNKQMDGRLYILAHFKEESKYAPVVKSMILVCSTFRKEL